LAEFLLAWERSVFVKAFHWLDEAHSHYGRQVALFKVCQFKCLSHPKTTLTETSIIMFGQISGHHGPAK